MDEYEAAPMMNVEDDDDHHRRHARGGGGDGGGWGWGWGDAADGGPAAAGAATNANAPGGSAQMVLVKDRSSNNNKNNNSRKRSRDDMDYYDYCSPLSSSLSSDDRTAILTAAAGSAGLSSSSSSTVIPPTLDELLRLAEDPNFEELARQYPLFRTAWQTVRQTQKQQQQQQRQQQQNSSTATTATTSFSSCITQSFTIQLSKALLKRLFNVELPYLDEQHLCPPIPNRFFYVQWIYKELLLSGLSLQTEEEQASYIFVRGLDIGTGASCIYPLLACNKTTLASVSRTAAATAKLGEISTTTTTTTTTTTMMYTTEVDEYAYQLACQNVSANRNRLFDESTNSIQVLKVLPSCKQQLQQQQQQQQERLSKDHVYGDDQMMETDDDVNINDNNDIDDIVHQQQQQKKLDQVVEEVAVIPGGPLRRALDAILTTTTSSSSSSRNDGTVMQQQQPQHQLNFCMTNPPFYDSTTTSTSITDEDVVSRPLEGNGRSRTQMTVSEGTYPGGEIGFVFDIFIDWYQTLVVACTASAASSSSSLVQSHPAPLTLPPKWCSAMIGKKTSFQYIYKVLTKIVGIGNVQATEYGPGIYTRWFIAWRTPPQSTPYSIRSLPSTLLPRHPTKDHFVVTINSDSDGDDGDSSNMDHDQTDPSNDISRPTLLTTVVARIEDYCNSNPGGWDLKTITTTTTATNADPSTRRTVTITERHPKPVVYYVDAMQHTTENNGIVVNDDVIPHEIFQLLHQQSAQQQSQDSQSYSSPQQSWLPTEGHFLIDIDLRIISQSSSSSSSAAAAAAAAVVDVTMTCCRRHSTRGMKAIEKIRSTLEGEICRTNRKWRKIRQRKQQQQQQQMMQQQQQQLS